MANLPSRQTKEAVPCHVYKPQPHLVAQIFYFTWFGKSLARRQECKTKHAWRELLLSETSCLQKLSRNGLHVLIL